MHKNKTQEATTNNPPEYPTSKPSTNTESFCPGAERRSEFTTEYPG